MLKIRSSIMISDINELINLCKQEIKYREYSPVYCEWLINTWESVKKWMEVNDINNFNEIVANQYCDEIIGGHLISAKMSGINKKILRALRMLVSYQNNREFENRSPRVEYIFDGIIGQHVLNYLKYCSDTLHRHKGTISYQQNLLYYFVKYLNANSISYEDLSVERIEEFFLQNTCSSAGVKHRLSVVIKSFLKYLYDSGITNRDCSIYVLRDKYKKTRKIPDTYTEDEIKSMIACVERGSAIGKRDYLILLLVSEYGWRAGDVTHFRIDYIDWEQNVIRFSQQKTNYPIEFPLLASVGNAIIDYLKNGRPDSKVPEIIVSHNKENKGKPLTSPTIHSIVTRYLRKAEIPNWSKKKHGPHALRHSFATNMLNKHITLPVISTVMGHQSTETTSTYISLDSEQLKKCALPMPELHSPYYK